MEQEQLAEARYHYHTRGGDWGLGHGDPPAGLDGVHEDGLHRCRRCPGIAAGDAEERGEERGGPLHCAGRQAQLSATDKCSCRRDELC